MKYPNFKKNLQKNRGKVRINIQVKQDWAAKREEERQSHPTTSLKGHSLTATNTWCLTHKPRASSPLAEAIPLEFSEELQHGRRTYSETVSNVKGGIWKYNKSRGQWGN